MYTQVVLILILLDVQYLQNVIVTFEKDSNGQNHSSSSSHQPIKKFPQKNFWFCPTGWGISPPHPLRLFGKLWKDQLDISLSNSNYFTLVKRCWHKSCIMDFMSTKMEFASAIFKKLYFSKYSIKRCCKQITSIQKLVWPYK